MVSNFDILLRIFDRGKITQVIVLLHQSSFYNIRAFLITLEMGSLYSPAQAPAPSVILVKFPYFLYWPTIAFYKNLQFYSTQKKQFTSLRIKRRRIISKLDLSVNGRDSGSKIKIFTYSITIKEGISNLKIQKTNTSLICF